MNNNHYVLAVAVTAFLFICTIVPIDEENYESHGRQLIGRIFQDIPIAIGAFLGWRKARVRGLCPGGLIGVCVGKALNRFFGEESYELVFPAVITAIASKLTVNQQWYAVAGFTFWWIFLARTPLF